MGRLVELDVSLRGITFLSSPHVTPRKGVESRATSPMIAGPFRILWLVTAISAGGLGLDIASREPEPPAALATLPSGEISDASVRPLPFFFDLYTFRGENDSTTVVAAFAVEAGNLDTKRVGDNNRYRFNVTLLLADAALGSVTNRHDSVFVDLPRRMRDEHLLYTHIEVKTPPSRRIRRTVFMIDATEAGTGQVYWEFVQIPDYSGTELMLSDVALGLPDAQIGWERGGATLALLPTRQVPSRAFDIYYEIYNLPTGNPYTTEITFERVAVSSREKAEDYVPVRLRFEGESTSAAEGTMSEMRRVETSFEKGRYRMTVTVEDLIEGKTASRSRMFELRTSGRDATMVPAVPVAPLIR